MRRLNKHLIGVDQGSVLMFSDFESGGPMWTGTGPRESRQGVRFAAAFARAPAVQVSVTMWDSDRRTNQRCDLTAEAVTVAGFTLVFRTWGDSRVARLRADWLAIGELPDEDDWDVA